MCCLGNSHERFLMAMAVFGEWLCCRFASPARPRTAQTSGDLLLKYHPKWRQVALAESSNNICNKASCQMEAIMRAYIVIGTLDVLAVSAGIYTAHTQDRLIAGLNCT